MYDPFGRRIDYLRISITDKCNLRCTYCMPEEGVPLRSHHDLLSFEQIVQIVERAAANGITKVRLTGGEPLVRRGVVGLVEAIAKVPGVEMVAMTTNGVLLPRYAPDLKRAGLDRLNISIDTLDPRSYCRLTRGGRIEDAIAGALAAHRAGFSGIKINMVVDEQKDASGETARMQEFCDQNGFILQRIALYHLDATKRDPLSADRPLPCSECNRIRLLSDGVLKPCLHSDDEIPVDLNDIDASLHAAVAAKPREGSVCTTRSMMEIGG